MNHLKNLFAQLNILEMKHQKIDDISINSFNIFSILRKENDEVHLHSKFIYELLNPYGSHQQSDIFLKLFIKELQIEFFDNSIHIFREKFNIDILIQSKQQSIIIENKIDTQDHSEQLSTYWQTISNQGYKDENIYLIYLTLFEEEPNEISIRDKVINISYSVQIRHWLEGCIKEVALLPTLRETLVQYLNLINKLTHQSYHKGFILEVKEFLLSDNNLQTVLNIEDSITEAKIHIQLNFWQTLLDQLSPYYKFEFYSLNGDTTLEKSVQKYYKKQKNRKDYGVEYKVDDNLYFFIELRSTIYYGFYFIDENNIQDKELNRLNSISIDWEKLYWKYPNKPIDFETFNTPNVLNLIDQESREIDIKVISNEVIDLIKQYHKEPSPC